MWAPKVEPTARMLRVMRSKLKSQTCGASQWLDANPTFDPTEWTVGQMNMTFVAELDAAGLPHTDDFYGNGTNT